MSDGRAKRHDRANSSSGYAGPLIAALDRAASFSCASRAFRSWKKNVGSCVNEVAVARYAGVPDDAVAAKGQARGNHAPPQETEYRETTDRVSSLCPRSSRDWQPPFDRESRRPSGKRERERERTGSNVVVAVGARGIGSSKKEPGQTGVRQPLLIRVPERPVSLLSSLLLSSPLLSSPRLSSSPISLRPLRSSVRSPENFEFAARDSVLRAPTVRPFPLRLIVLPVIRLVGEQTGKCRRSGAVTSIRCSVDEIHAHDDVHAQP